MDQDRRLGIADQLRRATRRWTEPADQWRTKVQHWVDAGIVSPAQGDEILALETSEVEPTPDRTSVDEVRPTLSPVVESVSYFGVVVVGLSTVLFLGHYWSGIGIAGHLIGALSVTVAGLAGGSVVAQVGDAGSRRLSGFLRLIGTAGAAVTAAVAVGPATTAHHGLTLLCVGVVVTALSAALWRNRERSLQFLSMLLGVAMTLGGVGTVGHLHATSTEVALLVWFSAVAIGLMSLQMLRPAPTALVFGVLGSFLGAFALSFPNHLGGVLLGILSTLCAVGIGFALERPALVVVGALGFFMFDFRIFSIYLRSMDAALGAFILGLVLVLIALLRAWHSAANARGDAHAPVEVHADAEWYESR